MTSANYRVDWDSVNSGGDDTSSSTSYWMRDTIGEQAVGFSSSTNYAIRAGYRQGDTDMTILRFNIGTQNPSTKTAYTAFSEAGYSVTVASTTGYATGSFIGVIEDQGLSQDVAVGKIVSIANNVMTVDAWDGSPSSISATPTGGDDFVFLLDGNSVAFGTLSSGIGLTSLTHTSVLSNVENGYTVYVHVDGGLRYGTNATIAGVADGTVSVGSEEYGARVFGTTATSTGSDFAFTTSTRPIQLSTTYADDERVGLVYKISITPSTPAGNYAQLVTYTLTPNF
ncbi:hypothetical protein L0Y59_02785 [Candidatus Uhrbacteria bacterium]|nr:hypothetical protein [Candidatus Uhrbacteria bacterium]